jgi:hypothetical protein
MCFDPNRGADDPAPPGYPTAAVQATQIARQYVRQRNPDMFNTQSDFGRPGP